MRAILDLSGGRRPPVPARVLAILFLNERELYACATLLDGAPWYGLVPEDSDILVAVEAEF